MRVLIFIVLSFWFQQAVSATQTMTSTVKSVTLLQRSGIDGGAVQVFLNDPITNTSCAAVDVARGFFYSATAGGAGNQSGILGLNFMSIAVSAKAQELPVKVVYDSAACVSGFGVNFISITVDP